jgi:hypothetical protein
MFLDKLKGLVEFFGLFSQYPLWVRILSVFWAAFSCALIVILVVKYPNLGVRVIDAFKVSRDNRGINLQFRLKNFSDDNAELTSAKLTFYKNSLNVGGLQSERQLSGKYVVTRDAATGTAVETIGEEKDGLPAEIIFPMQGQDDLAEVTLHLSQEIPKKDGDRFQISVKADNFPPAGSKFVQVVFCYDKDQKTPPYLIDLAK